LTPEVLAACLRVKSLARPVTSLPLTQFVPRISRTLQTPAHLSALCDAFDRIRSGEEVRLLVSVPPQHGKTFTILHGLAQLIAARPTRTNAYISYAADYAHSRSKLCRDYARTCNVQLRDDSSAVHEWRTTVGGGLIATGVGGPLTGQGIDGVLVVDDPYKNRKEADSAHQRGMIRDWWTSAALTRLHPHASIVVCHTRWHPDDLIGWLSKAEDDWTVINLPAVNDDGEALWPVARPADFLAKVRRRIGEHDWASLYQGQPRPRGSSVFRGVSFYDALPDTYRVSIGVDFAYSESSYADYSVAVVLAHSGDDFYVVDVVREQVDAPAFGRSIAALQHRYPGARTFAYTGGQERGIVDLLRKLGAKVATEAASSRGDKFARAQPVAAAWNEGQIHVPREAAWCQAFVDEVESFTGVKDDHDDQVDALAAAYDSTVTLRRGASSHSDADFGWS
jgi:predicted phage terminase large subunit-like protein